MHIQPAKALYLFLPLLLLLRHQKKIFFWNFIYTIHSIIPLLCIYLLSLLLLLLLENSFNLIRPYMLCALYFIFFVVFSLQWRSWCLFCSFFFTLIELDYSSIWCFQFYTFLSTCYLQIFYFFWVDSGIKVFSFLSLLKKFFHKIMKFDNGLCIHVYIDDLNQVSLHFNLFTFIFSFLHLKHVYGIYNGNYYMEKKEGI